ncbi:MAG TPA: hypothetical protein VGY48_15475 [Vicinamibacterales bacterium]|jgi:hypothetical protein|nr:hypothetical protein [Vicinamibacterales bacterium]
MNPSDVPPTAFIQSFLLAAQKAEIEATVVYTVNKNGVRKTSASSNKGPEGIAFAAKVLKTGDTSVEQAAIALHEFRIKFEGDISGLPEDVQAEMNKCFVCREPTPWDQLDEPDRSGHREIAKAVIAAALMGVAQEQPSRLVTV